MPFKNTVKVGAQPIAWSNDDFRQLGADTPLEQCLSEMRMAGYAGSELGNKFPKDVEQLTPILANYDLQLITAWHSSYILDKSFDEEVAVFERHLDFLSGMESSVVIVAECSQRIYNTLGKSLVQNFGEDLNNGNMNKLADGMNRLGEIALKRGMKLVYHSHIGTLIQNGSEVDRLMEKTDEALVYLTADTGHVALAGGDVYDFFDRHRHRIGHVHMKNVRQNVVDRVWQELWSFEKSVKEGVFTVPGDAEGEIDYVPLFKILNDVNYSGWFVVEAEQDPTKADPLEYFTLAREYIRDIAGI